MSKSFDEWYKDQKEFQKEWAEQELGIVRCKECKYWNKSDNAVWCRRTAIGIFRMEEDDFCSRGERAE